MDPEMDPIVRYRGSQGRGHYRLLHGKDSDSHKKVQRDPLKHSGHWCLLLASGNEPWYIRYRSLAHQWSSRACHLCTAYSDGIAPRASSS